MNQSLVVEILLGVLAVMIGVGAYLGAARANRATEVTARYAIDQKAYERAQMIYESALKVSEQQVEGLRARVATLEGRVQSLTEANYTLDAQLAHLTVSNRTLAGEVDRLRSHNDRLENEESGDNETT
jgi:small-conductance mechanosensitive channel